MLQVTLQAGVAYGIIVDGKYAAFGTYQIDITAMQVCSLLHSNKATTPQLPSAGSSLLLAALISSELNPKP